jgi:hypothetical protein
VQSIPVIKDPTFLNGLRAICFSVQYIVRYSAPDGIFFLHLPVFDATVNFNNRGCFIFNAIQRLRGLKLGPINYLGA